MPPETWKLELKCNVIMEAKNKLKHVVCNLVVDVLIDGLVGSLQYPDFCAILLVFYLKTLFPTIRTSVAYSLTSVMHRVSSEWSRWEMSADDVLFSTRCHNYLAEKICYRNENREKIYFFLVQIKSLEILACLFYIICVHTGKLRWILNCIKVNDCLMNKRNKCDELCKN